MWWAGLAAHLQQESTKVLLGFCGWVQGEIDELEDVCPLSAKHKKIKKLLNQRAAQQAAQLFTKRTVIELFRWEDQARGLKSQI